GCGNSALSHDLHELGYTDVTSIDFSPACIAAMRARYAHCPGLRWAVMDIRALAFPDATFDLVLEKGTLDVLMVEETDPWNVSPQATASMHRVLAEVWVGGGRGWTPCLFWGGGRGKEFWGAGRGCVWGGTFHYFLYIMRKGQPLDAPDLALGRRLHQPPPPLVPLAPAALDDDEDYLFAIQL
ncbi:EFMT4 methyltransferase, partial [Hemiprocne comata]|nr:EFMT4 methyltransferase [Hemiprocne comata]